MCGVALKGFLLKSSYPKVNQVGQLRRKNMEKAHEKCCILYIHITGVVKTK